MACVFRGGSDASASELHQTPEQERPLKRDQARNAEDQDERKLHVLMLVDGRTVAL